MSQNIILTKTFAFSKRIIFLYQKLKENKEFDIGRQILRSGTSIGANAEEAQGGSSKKDFLNKLAISYKEARETHYWLRLLKECNLIEQEDANSLLIDCEEILKILTSILKTSKQA